MVDLPARAPARTLLPLVALGVLAASTACTDSIPDGLRRTPAGNGASVRWDSYAKPLPAIPLPNDAATWPDPTSRTGQRINASTLAPTSVERVVREKFDQLEGFGTFAPITISFDKRDPNDPRAALDLQGIADRHQGDDYEFADDAFYLVNLTTGVPVPLDLGAGSFQYVVKDKAKYWTNDHHRWEQNLLFETLDETIDPVTRAFDPARTTDGTRSGQGVYRPEWDQDFDGVLDRPNLLDPTGCQDTWAFLAEREGKDALEQQELEAARDRCITDSLLTWYERETDTLVARPLIPLEEMTRYAFVVTDRVRDADGKPVRSPFEFVYHPGQESGVARLQEHLENPKLATYFGDLGGSGLAHVAFAFTYTTSPVFEDMRVLRDGLYGKGPFARFAKEFPARADAPYSVGTINREDAEGGAVEPDGWQDLTQCAGKTSTPYMVDLVQIQETVKSLAQQGFGIDGPELDDLVASLGNLSHLIVGTVDAPYLIDGGPENKDPNASFDVDFRTGDAAKHRDKITFLISVPRETATRKQPFPITYYGHGYTGASVESLGFAGRMAEQGIATIGVNAVSHGIALDEQTAGLGKSLFKQACYAPFASTFFDGRAKDLDGDSLRDSGGDYWTAYLFHTRDVVRQSALDLVQIFRTLKGFDGQQKSHLDLNGNGQLDDLAGDFDADGTPDVGGPSVDFYTWGQSLGGILAPFVAALDPQVVAAAPSAGAGGLLDVGARTTNGGAFEGIYLRLFGTLVVSTPACRERDGTGACTRRRDGTACGDSEHSLRFIVVNVNTTAEVEFGCVDPAKFATGGTVFARNRTSGQVRCARVATDGTFRMSLPTTTGDALELDLYDVPDAVDTYDGEAGCNPTVGEEARVALIDTWGKGWVPNGAPDPLGLVEGPVCETEDGCIKWQNTYIPAGSPLYAVTDGFGMPRQTPSLRRMLNVAASIIDSGDPINFTPYYALRPTVDHEGQPMPPKALLNMVQIGDTDVPLSAGIASGRAAGAVPFLRPDAAERYFAHADYVTPAKLYADLGGRTPNAVLVDEGVLEGMARLLRHPAPGCRRNVVAYSAADVYCHPNCETEGSGDGCPSDTVCANVAAAGDPPALRCVEAPVWEGDCRQYLYDPDGIDEGQMGYGEGEATTPLRLGRIATPASPDTITDVWAPRLLGTPGTADAQGWQGNARVLAQLMTYIYPRGNHGIEPNNPCEAFQVGRYFTNLIGRFFATSGADLYYLSHPTTHHCLAREEDAGGCNFVESPK
ncbi:MAG: hypothetical protein IT376_05760 [Polyangiaceae bacterium]|nr:hypothetical protein [Polyangiaceae bacterium]